MFIRHSGLLHTLMGIGCRDDLLMLHQGRIGFEIKYTDVPTVTRSMWAACEALELDRLIVVIPGRLMVSLAERTKVVGLERLNELA